MIYGPGPSRITRLLFIFGGKINPERGVLTQICPSYLAAPVFGSKMNVFQCEIFGPSSRMEIKRTRVNYS